MTAPITLTGRLTKDPELRFSATGMAVANMSVVTSRRAKVNDEWTDLDVTYWSVAAFKQLAENVGESLRKGDAVIVTGKMKSRQYDDREGNKRTVWEVTADHVGADLSRATANITRVSRTQPAAPLNNGAQADPWSQPLVDDTTDIPF